MGGERIKELSFANFSGLLQKIVDRESYISTSIIPRMDRRRDRKQALTREEIEKRLRRPPISGKPGDEHEMMLAMHKTRDGLSPEFAAEIADNVYYCLQPNAPTGDLRSLKIFLGIIGVDMETAYALCILKYELRL